MTYEDQLVSELRIAASQSGFRVRNGFHEDAARLAIRRVLQAQAVGSDLTTPSVNNLIQATQKEYLDRPEPVGGLLASTIGWWFVSAFLKWAILKLIRRYQQHNP